VKVRAIELTKRRSQGRRAGFACGLAKEGREAFQPGGRANRQLPCQVLAAWTAQPGFNVLSGLTESMCLENAGSPSTVNWKNSIVNFLTMHIQ